MRRSICYCEPSQAYAGQVRKWKFIYTSATPIPKGARLKFRLDSKGREIDWQAPSVSLKKTSNTIYALLDGGKILQAKEIPVEGSFVPDYEFSLPAQLDAGSNFTIVIGSPKLTEDVANGTRCQTNAQRRRSFELYIDPTAKGKFGDPEVFSLDVKGGKLSNIKILSPSFVVRNKRFDVIARFEDEYGNLTSNSDDDTLIELSHEHLRENLNWKLFVPETGFISLPNLYFNEPGIYTITLKNSKTKEEFKSAPIKCFPENTKFLFWGLLHGESEKIDSTENIESCLRHFRDEKSLNFYSTSSFEAIEETPNEMWKLITQNALDFDENERFNTFIGCQWTGVPKEEGSRVFVNLKDNKQIFRKKDPKHASLKKIYKSYSPKELISIPTFTMGKGLEFDFKDWDPDFERVVEIYNSWGSSECSSKEGNPLPISATSKAGIQESVDGSIQKALLRNCRFGFVGGGLDDRGHYSDFFEGGQEQYTPGLTGVLATEQSKASIAEALYNRSCYATTGERIILGFQLAGQQMGTELTTAVKHGLTVNRHLTGYAAGTCKLDKVELIRNGAVIKTWKPDQCSFDFEFDDLSPIDKVVHDAKDKKPPFIYYYIRVTQEDGHMAWGSPIWVDYVPGAPRKITKPSPKPVDKKVVEKVLLEEEDEEDFDDDFDDEDDEE